MPLLVRASNGTGSIAVALEDPMEALRSIDELKQAGFGKIGVYDFTGKELDLSELRAGTEMPNSDATTNIRAPNGAP